VSNNTGVFANYAYRIRLTNAGTLALGLSAGVSQFKANLSEVKSSSNTAVSDPAFSENQVRMLPNFGAGIYYSTDKLYMGISMPHLLNNKLANDFANATGNERARQFRHLFVAFGGVLAVSNNLKLKPSLLYKYVHAAPMQLDLNCNFWFHDVFALGASYRTDKTVVALVEIQATPQFRVGYAYDLNFKKISPANSGSHEIMMRYEFAFNKKKFLTPRYF
jgi:type IX secretion system PorP/SprF family membrane protein